MRIHSDGELFVGATGQGVSLSGGTTGAGNVTGINADRSAYKKLVLNALDHDIKTSGTSRFIINAAGKTYAAMGGNAVYATRDGETTSENYASSLKGYAGGTTPNRLQLGNNGTNEIVAGSVAVGGALSLIVNNTSAQGVAHNGTVALTISSTGTVTIPGNTTIGAGAAAVTVGGGSSAAAGATAKDLTLSAWSVNAGATNDYGGDLSLNAGVGTGNASGKLGSVRIKAGIGGAATANGTLLEVGTFSSTGLAVTGTGTFSGALTVSGGIKDKNNSTGSSSHVLHSDGLNRVYWTTAPSATIPSSVTHKYYTYITGSSSEDYYTITHSLGAQEVIVSVKRGISGTATRAERFTANAGVLLDVGYDVQVTNCDANGGISSNHISLYFDGYTIVDGEYLYVTVIG